jgi:hypothetical protein
VGVSIHKDDGEEMRKSWAGLHPYVPVIVLRLLIDLDGKAYGG